MQILRNFHFESRLQQKEIYYIILIVRSFNLKNNKKEVNREYKLFRIT